MIDLSPWYPSSSTPSLSQASSYRCLNSDHPRSVFSNAAISGSIRKTGTISTGIWDMTSASVGRLRHPEVEDHRFQTGTA